MRILRHYRESDFKKPVIALGNFDGLHRGHEAILERTLALAAETGGDPVVLTFYPHPVSVLAPDRAPVQIASLGERLRGLRRLGAAGVIVQRFTPAFAAVEAESFLRDILQGSLGASGIVAGFNVSFGQGRGGTPGLLRSQGETLGLRVEIVSQVAGSVGRVSSSAIRAAISLGDVAVAGRLLGHLHRVSGRVRRGEQRGASIGFPTANILPHGGMLPPDGVYAVRVGLASTGEEFGGVANLGTNPTFGGVGRRLEAHIFDYTGDLYGAEIVVKFVDRLRGEIRFPSVPALVEQIAEDARQARVVLLGDT